MSETIPNPKLLELKSSKFTIETLKDHLFKDLTPSEILFTLNKMKEDLITSNLTDDDAVYRSEILIVVSTFQNIVYGLCKDINPNEVDLLKIISKNLD